MFVGEEEIIDLSEVARWLTVAKVNTHKFFNRDSFKDTMGHAWNLMHEPEIREDSDYLFVIQCYCLGDWNKIMQHGLWIFRGLVVMIEEYDGKGIPGSVTLECISVWAQIHDITNLYRSQPKGDQLAQRIGQAKSIEMNLARVYEGNCVRVRAKIEVSNPLTRFTRLNVNGKESIFLLVKYEKLGYLCLWHPRPHNMEECGDGFHGTEKR